MQRLISFFYGFARIPLLTLLLLAGCGSFPSITSFTPTSGVVGTTVTINGTGFSTTAASNAVMFNGTAATVSSATSTIIVTKVPSGATTGAISVTVDGKTELTTSSFTVIPTITSFLPSSGSVGTTVTITGTGFDGTTLANNSVTFNGTSATLTSATSTSIVVTVPTGATTGVITVTVNGKSVSTSSNFTVI